MMQTHLQYRAQALRLEKIIFAIEAILVYVAALFTSAILPSLLIQYVFKTANPFETPKVLEYIPVAAFLIATGYFIYAAITVSNKALQIKKLDKQMADCDCNKDCCGGMEELAELEKLAEKAISASAKKPVKKKAAKKTAKKK